jgi:cellulose synthase operon protein C
MAELIAIASEHFEALLKSVQPAEAPQVTPERARLREHVAILSAFDAAILPPSTKGQARDPEIESFLVEDCERVITRGGQRWSLREDFRIETLAALDHRGHLRHFGGATDQADAACRMALQYIRGTAPALKRQTLEELQGTTRASAWLSGTRAKIPSGAQARAQLAIESMLQPLRILLAEGFVGRAQELKRLSDYAEVLPPSRRLTAVVQRVRRIVNLRDKPPLLISGPGGAGKSTLVAKFVLDHIDTSNVYRFPFAYLSFDRSELRPEQPVSLLAEAADQLGALFPDVRNDAAQLAIAARNIVASSVAPGLERRSTQGSSGSAIEWENADEQILVSRFAALIEIAVGTRDVPNVWVLDTFEVAQRQAPTVIDRLWKFIDHLQGACPRLRVVLCGRAQISGHRTLDMPLGDLDAASALEMLHTQLADLELPEEFLARIVKMVSAQPISLRLAVLLVRAEAEKGKGLGTEELSRDLLLRLPANEVQGVLYGRILDHIADYDVRRIAHPGLALRRVTPEVIQSVLARRCGLGDIGGRQAQNLFYSLQQQVSLVEPDGSDGVRLRPEIRRVLLPMIERDNPGVLASLRQAALRYYSKQTSLEAKLDELYYRLALGQSTATLDRAFDSDAARALNDVVDEFPASSQVYLANRLGITVAAEVRVQADDLSWARQSKLAARRLLDAGRPAEALELVTARQGDSIRPFTAALKVEALAALHRLDEALATASAELEWCTDHREVATFIDVALLAARIAEDAGDFEGALRKLREVDRVTESAHDDIGRLTARVAILRVYRRDGTSSSEDAQAMRADVIERAGQLTSRNRSRNPGLMRELAAEVGDELPAIAEDALRLSGLKPVQVAGLARPAHPDASEPMTSMERGEKIRDVVSGGQAADVAEAVRESLRSESDEKAF